MRHGLNLGKRLDSGIFSFSDISAVPFLAINGGGVFSRTVFGTIPGFTLATSAEAYTNRARMITVPGSYSATIGMIPQLDGDGTTNHNPLAGLMVRESATAKAHGIAIGLLDGLTPLVFSIKSTDDATFSATYTTATALRYPYNGGLLWLRMLDDGAARRASLSIDGQNFIEVTSVARTDFLTADQIGIFVNANTSTKRVSAAFVSWQLS